MKKIKNSKLLASIILLTLALLCLFGYYKLEQVTDYFYTAYFNFKKKEEIKKIFNDKALDYNKKNYHNGSGWDYLTAKEYKEIILDGISKMNPQIKNHEKIFEIGVGVGAALKVIENEINDQLEIGGSDISENAITQVKKLFPKQAENFFVADMTQNFKNVPDNYYDHTLSFGALAMYLTKSQMKKAIKEAVRITKPGGSILITHFIAPGGKKIGSIITPVNQSFFEENANEWGIENIRIYNMKHQGDRYQITFHKKS